MNRFHSLIGRDRYLVSIRTVAGWGMDPHFLCLCTLPASVCVFVYVKKKYLSACPFYERIKFEVNLYVKL
jgi:hypothetical protein